MPSDGTLQIALVDGAMATSVVHKGFKEVQILQYEPSTQLVTLSLGTASEVAELDRLAGRLDHLAGIARGHRQAERVRAPVSPTLARGTKLVQITMRERSTVKWLRDPRALDKPTATVTVDGPFAGADAAGHVYMWRSTPSGKLELAVYADGKLSRTLPNTGVIALWPEPTGEPP